MLRWCLYLCMQSLETYVCRILATSTPVLLSERGLAVEVIFDADWIYAVLIRQSYLPDSGEGTIVPEISTISTMSIDFDELSVLPLPSLLATKKHEEKKSSDARIWTDLKCHLGRTRPCRRNKIKWGLSRSHGSHVHSVQTNSSLRSGLAQRRSWTPAIQRELLEFMNSVAFRVRWVLRHPFLYWADNGSSGIHPPGNKLPEQTCSIH